MTSRDRLPTAHPERRLPKSDATSIDVIGARS